MGNILISMPKVDDANKIAGIIRSAGLMLDVEVCQTGAEILRTVNDRDFGVVICTKRLKDMSVSELAGYLPEFFGMIVLTSDPSVELSREGCVKLLYPFKGRDLIATIDLLTTSFIRPRRKKKTGPKQRSDEERRIIDRAKAVLMDRNAMMEPEAFRYLQKSSMDCGRSLLETAQMVIMMAN